MDVPCTGAVHRASTCPVHRGCHRGVLSQETVIGGAVTRSSHFQDTVNDPVWDIAK